MKILIAIYVDSTKSGTTWAVPAVPLPSALDCIASIKSQGLEKSLSI